MDLFERSVSFAIGGGLGFILGYIAARLRAIEMKVETVQKEVHEVHEHEIDVTLRDARTHNEDGFLKIPTAAHVMMVLVLLITAYAAFAASRTNRALDDTVACLTDFNTNQNIALTTRDGAIKDSADAEIKLWTLYDKLYKQAEANPKKIPVIQEELNKAIGTYRLTLIDTQHVRDTYEYDDPDILNNCERKQEHE